MRGNARVSGYIRNKITGAYIDGTQTATSITLISHRCYGSSLSLCNDVYTTTADSSGYFSFWVNPSNHTIEYVPYNISVSVPGYWFMTANIGIPPSEDVVYATVLIQ